jgi:hypothetical protein
MEMKMGDQVWLEGKNLQVIGSRKLLPKWYGPFTILEQIEQVAYQLELPASMNVTGSWNKASSYASWTGVSSGTGQKSVCLIASLYD